MVDTKKSTINKETTEKKKQDALNCDQTIKQLSKGKKTNATNTSSYT